MFKNGVEKLEAIAIKADPNIANIWNDVNILIVI